MDTALFVVHLGHTHFKLFAVQFTSNSLQVFPHSIKVNCILHLSLLRSLSFFLSLSHTHTYTLTPLACFKTSSRFLVCSRLTFPGIRRTSFDCNTTSRLQSLCPAQATVTSFSELLRQLSSTVRTRLRGLKLHMKHYTHVPPETPCQLYLTKVIKTVTRGTLGQLHFSNACKG